MDASYEIRRGKHSDFEWLVLLKHGVCVLILVVRFFCVVLREDCLVLWDIEGGRG